jgi:DNA-binding NtrC family response regulator
MSGFDDEETRSLAWSGTSDEPRVVAMWEGGMVVRPLHVGKSLVVGRAKDCDLPILHQTVSRHHARITPQAPPAAPMRIEDLDSAHGIRVDGAVVREACDVWPGQVVEVGAAIVLVQGLPPKQSTATGMPLDRFVALIAKSSLPVLILGETGAGKEVMALRIHRGSARGEGPFVQINCAAFPETLLESELFGHEKGAFTGATHAKPGLIETADGGTLVLDEVGEMPAGAQATLLRALETQEVRRIGSLRPTTVNVRIISATNRDLESRVREGKFRQDLLYRLNGATIRVPSLRERRDEIVPLAEELVARAAEKAGVPVPMLTAEAKRVLVRHGWPGNVRELRNVTERALAIAEGGAIDAHHLMLEDAAPPSEPPKQSLLTELDALERDKIVQALATTDGNQTRAAALLGISRRALINRLDTYKLPRPRKPG